MTVALHPVGRYWPLYRQNSNENYRQGRRKKRIYKATVTGAHHVLFSLVSDVIGLNQQAQDANLLDEQDMQQFDNDIKKAVAQLNKLEKLTDVTEDRIREIVLLVTDE